MAKNESLGATLGIEIVSQTADCVEAVMPITPHITQYAGYVHGGATIALLETVASQASVLRADWETERVFGIESHIRHWKSGIAGTVHGIARFNHAEGDKLYWDVAAYDDAGDVMSDGTFVTKVVSLKRLAEKERQRSAQGDD